MIITNNNHCILVIVSNVILNELVASNNNRNYICNVKVFEKYSKYTIKIINYSQFGELYLFACSRFWC